MKKIIVLLILCSCILFFEKCSKPQAFPESQYDERLSGGSQTAFDNSSHAFTHEFEGLSGYDLGVHESGDAAFEQTFIAAPAHINSGLGGGYNNVSCISCHHNDGIGLPTAGAPQSSLLMRISLPGTGEHGGAVPVPGYGTQVQDRAIIGKAPEAKGICLIDI